MQKRFNSLKKLTAYEYGSVGDAMGMSIEQLSDELRDIYASFAIFSEDVPVPATVSHRLRARRALMLFNDDSLRTRRVQWRQIALRRWKFFFFFFFFFLGGGGGRHCLWSMACPPPPPPPPSFVCSECSGATGRVFLPSRVCTVIVPFWFLNGTSFNSVNSFWLSTDNF